MKLLEAPLNWSGIQIWHIQILSSRNAFCACINWICAVVILAPLLSFKIRRARHCILTARTPSAVMPVQSKRLISRKNLSRCAISIRAWLVTREHEFIHRRCKCKHPLATCITPTSVICLHPIINKLSSGHPVAITVKLASVRFMYPQSNEVRFRKYLPIQEMDRSVARGTPYKFSRLSSVQFVAISIKPSSLISRQ